VSERGAIVIFTAFVLVALLAILGLAIDAGNIYRAQLALQNATDVASLGTVNHITMQGKLNFLQKAGAEGALPVDEVAKVQDYLNITMHEMPHNHVRANMALAGFAHSAANPITVTPQYAVGDPDSGDSAYDYQIQATRPVNLLLMRAVPIYSGGSQISVGSTSLSRRRKLNASLVLDISGSMNCPKSGECACLKPAADGSRVSCPTTPNRRFDDLAEAVADFMRMLDIDRDNIHVVPFNINASAAKTDEIRALFNVLGPLTNSVIDSIRDNFKDTFPPASGTNFCDALMQAYGRMWVKHNRTAETVNYIFFTDGAPTAGRFLFSDAAAKKANLAINRVFYPPEDPADPTSGPVPSYPGDYDYLSYTIEWVDNNNKIIAGPSVLVPSRYLCGSGGVMCSSTVTQFENPMFDESVVYRGTGGCNDGLATVNADFGAAPPVASQAAVAGVANQVFGPCLNSFESHLPWNKLSTYDLTIGDPPVFAGFGEWRKAYYNCALQVADFIRSQRGMFYVVGLGEKPAAGTFDPSDPYENVSDSFHRKDIFLTRLALDYRQMDSSKPEFDFQGYSDYAGSASNPRMRGIYMPTHNSSDIRLLFIEIARKLLLKLVS